MSATNDHVVPYRAIPHGTEWMEQGACYTMNSIVFEQTVLPQARDACNSCEVRDTCLDHLLSWPEQVGYGGGMTEQQRLKEAGAREWAERKRRQKRRADERAKAQSQQPNKQATAV